LQHLTHNTTCLIAASQTRFHAAARAGEFRYPRPRWVACTLVIRSTAVRLASILNAGLAIMSKADPLEIFLRPPVPKVAILIDGGDFLKRLPAVLPKINADDPQGVIGGLQQLVVSHLKHLNETHKVPNPFALLYRTFYHGARPYDQKAHTPIRRRAIDHAKTQPARFRMDLFDALCSVPNLAVRLGEVRKGIGEFWALRPHSQKDLLAGHKTVQDLGDDNFVPSLRQKGVDMRIGLDIASIALKRRAETIVLVSGDADFVPAARMARREGIQFVLDPLWQDIPRDLFEHIDGLRSGFPRPQRRRGSG